MGESHPRSWASQDRSPTRGDYDRADRSELRPLATGNVDGDAGENRLELVEWRRLGRRISLLTLGWAGLAVLGVAFSALFGDLRAGALWTGAAALGLLASVLGAVALSAFGGMLRAGERRERLASGDVGLMPPQVRRRRSHGGGEGA